MSLGEFQLLPFWDLGLDTLSLLDLGKLENLVVDPLLEPRLVLNLKPNLGSTSFIRLDPLKLLILPLQSSLFNLLSMHHQMRDIHIVM